MRYEDGYRSVKAERGDVDGKDDVLDIVEEDP
jgi:hypothetical protein